MSSPKPRGIRLVEDRWATARHVVEAIAIVAAGLWAFYPFVYQEKIKPANAPAALYDSISIQRLGRDRRREILNVVVTYRNSGLTEIDIAADGWNVWGERFSLRASVAETIRPNRLEYSRKVPVVSNTIVWAFAEERDMAAGGRDDDHIILEPGETVVSGKVPVLPRGAYDSLHAQILAVPIKSSEKHKIAVSIVKRDGGYWLETQNKAFFVTDNQSDFALVP